MPYILYHAQHGPLARFDAPAHTAQARDNEMIIPCEAGADVDDRERWDAEAALMREHGLIAPTEALAYEYLQGMFSEKIQARLDAFAKSEGKFYDNMLSLCTYATSTNPVFAREGQYGVEARDATWDAANAILGAVLTGERPIPAWEELEAELPVLQWPEHQGDAQ